MLKIFVNHFFLIIFAAKQFRKNFNGQDKIQIQPGVAEI